MHFSDNASEITEWLSQIRDLRKMKEEREDLPLQHFYDMRDSIARMRLEGTHMEEEELFNLKKSLDTIDALIKIVRNDNIEEDTESEEPLTPKEALGYGKTYPALYRMADGVATFPEIVRLIDRTLDKFGKVKDSASPTLQRIRRELAQTEGSISRILGGILRSAQSEGLVEKDAAPALRDGRLVIPVAPGLKKKIRGIVHDESASGRTVYIEPDEVVEANNKVRELENDERREVIRILKEIAAEIRPWWKEMLDSYTFLAKIDFVNAKVSLAEYLTAIEPQVKTKPMVDMIEARHPLLQLSLQKQNKKVVPLEIKLTSDKRILIISGPNAGGKSVCLKTTGLIQYMLQCGLSIPVSERSTLGIFSDIMIDIGDEQSIENDLSTYSSHLTNMKNMIRQAGHRTLILIDEFGTGTEPGIGGAIAEAVLQKFCEHGAFGVITTHYTNLKLYASGPDTGVINGAMQFDAAKIQPLFKLDIGMPGNSFAFELARKMGLPENIVKDAETRAGEEFVGMERNLRKIVRNRRALDEKLQKIKNTDKTLDSITERYQKELEGIKQTKKEILDQAKKEAMEIVQGANKTIENTIRTIKESQADKEKTSVARKDLQEFITALQTKKESEQKNHDDYLDKKLKQLSERKRKSAARKNGIAQEAVRETSDQFRSGPLKVGEKVKVKDNGMVGEVVRVSNKAVTVAVGNITSKMPLDKVERISSNEYKAARKESVTPRSVIDNSGLRERRLRFSPELDVRGERVSDALDIVIHYIDDAVMLGVGSVRIIHGKGTGALRDELQRYLRTVPGVSSVHDEHIQFGGSGVTIVEFE